MIVEMHMDATGFMQESTSFWSAMKRLTGAIKNLFQRVNRFGDVTVSGFFNHIENQGQPQHVGMHKR